MFRFTIALILLLTFSIPMRMAAAQSTARGEIISYNVETFSAVLNVNESDMRYNQIPLAGGIVSLTIAGVTREAYLIPAEQEKDDLYNTLRLIGFDPTHDEIALVLIVARNASALKHLDEQTNPMNIFGAKIGDEVRVDAVAPLPEPIERETPVTITQVEVNGDLHLNLSAEEAARQGLFTNVSGILRSETADQSFMVISEDTYFTSDYADMYVFAVAEDLEVAEGSQPASFLKIAPHPNARETTSVVDVFAVDIGGSLTFDYQGFDYGDNAAGRVTDIQDNGMQLLTDIPGSYLDEIGTHPGSYVVVAVNGIIRAAMVMDEEMLAAAYQRGGLSSNYVVLRQTGIIKIIYMMQDGRTAQSIFNAENGSRVRMRPAQAVEAIVRAEAVVRVVSEIAPEGFLITDITPFELSYLEVLVGEFVDVRINGISYRARVVDEQLASRDDSEADILVFPDRDHSIITHTLNNSITAEARFQASVGDVVVFERAPN